MGLNVQELAVRYHGRDTRAGLKSSTPVSDGNEVRLE